MINTATLLAPGRKPLSVLNIWNVLVNARSSLGEPPIRRRRSIKSWSEFSSFSESNGRAILAVFPYNTMPIWTPSLLGPIAETNNLTKSLIWSKLSRLSTEPSRMKARSRRVPDVAKTKGE